MENQNENRPAVEPEVYPLDDASIGLLADIRKQLEALNEQGRQLNAQATGALVLFIRQHKLTGNWKPAENGKELVREPDPAPVPQQ